MKHLKSILAGSMILLATAVFAQDNDTPKAAPVKKGKGEYVKPDVRAQKQTERMTKQLTLSETQKPLVYEVLFERAKSVEVDKNTCKEDAKCLKLKRGERNKLADTKLKGILNPDQYQKLQELRKQRKSNKGKTDGTAPTKTSKEEISPEEDEN